MKKYYTVIEAGERLNRDRVTIYRYINDGRLAAHRDGTRGRKYLIPVQDVEDVYERRKNKRTNTEWLSVRALEEREERLLDELRAIEEIKRFIKDMNY